MSRTPEKTAPLTVAEMNERTFRKFAKKGETREHFFNSVFSAKTGKYLGQRGGAK